MDADKEGFLRSETSLIQTIGRAARNSEGRVILYADKITNSINKALQETSRRRKIQEKHNEENGITPTTIKKQLMNSLNLAVANLRDKNNDKKVMDLEVIENDIGKLKKQMHEAAENLEFEKATKLRDKIDKLQKSLLIIS